MPFRLPRLHVSLPALAVAAVLARLVAYKLFAIPFGGLAMAMCQYDCFWYVRLAVDGYGSDSKFASYDAIPNWAFFPLFPLLLRAVYALSSMGPYFLGVLVANALFAGFIVLSALYLRRTRGNLDAPLWVAFAVLFPFGYTFSAIYSESLFTLLTMAGLLLLRDRRPLAASVCIALLCATRPTGVLMLPLIAVDRALHLWNGRRRADRLALLGEALLPLAIAPLGLSLSMLAQYLSIGDALAFSHVQVLWDRVWVGPLATAMAGLGAWDWNLVLQPKGLPSQSYSAAWGVLGLAVAVFLGWRRRWAEAWLLAATILLPMSTALHSVPRFVATSPFFLFAVFEGVQTVRSRIGLAWMFGGAGMLHGLLLVFWFISASSTY